MIEVLTTQDVAQLVPIMIISYHVTITALYIANYSVDN